MNNVLLSIKTDMQTKQDLKDFSTELGVTTTAFVNMVVRQALRDRRVTLSTGLVPTPYLEGLIRTADADYAAGRNITTFHSKKAVLAHLRSLSKSTS